MLKNLNKWLKTNYTFNEFVEFIKEMLELNDYLSVNVVDLFAMINYENLFSDRGFVRITARLYGHKEISFSVTIKNDEDGDCEFFIEKDDHAVLLLIVPEITKGE